MFSFELLQLIMLFVTCILLAYTIYKMNHIKARLVQHIDQVGNNTGNNNPHKEEPFESDDITMQVLPDKAKTKRKSIMRIKDVRWLETLDELLTNELSSEFLKPIDLAEGMGICERQLQRKLKELTGTSPAEYIKRTRLEAAYQHLLFGDFQTISEVAYKVGYKGPDYFSRCFIKHFGIRPNDVLNSTVNLATA